MDRSERTCLRKISLFLFWGMIQPAAIIWNLSDGEFDLVQHSQNAWQLYADAIPPEQIENAKDGATMKKYVLASILIGVGIIIAFPFVQHDILHDGEDFHPRVLCLLP
jgi:hypothetical protein